MEDTKLAEAATATPSTAAADAADATLDLENMSLNQLDDLLGEGKVVLPPKPSGEETGKEPPPKAKVEEPPPGEKPPAAKTEPEKVEAIVETRTLDEIKAAMDAAAEEVRAAGGDEAAQQAAADLLAVPQAPKAKDPEPTAEEIAAAAKAKADADAAAADEVAGIERPRLKDQRDQLIAGIYMKAKRDAEAGNGVALTWAEAEARVDGPKVEKKADEAEASVDYTEIVGTLQTEVTAIKEKLTAAGADEGLFNAEISQLTQDLAEKTADLKLAQRDLKQAGEQAKREAAKALTASETARAGSKAEAIADWPDADVKGSALDEAVKAEIAALSQRDHPDHSILYADSAPWTIVSRVAKRLGIPPVAKAPVTPAAKPKVEAPPRKAMSPASGAKTAVQEKPAEAAKQTFEYLSTEASLEELDQFMGGAAPEKLLAGVVH